MSDVLSPLPVRRPELAVVPLGEKGKHVVKDPVSGDFFHLGAVEAFLLEQLDGEHTPAQICAAFESRFDDPLAEDELTEFLELAQTRGFLTAAPLTSDEAPAPAAEKRVLEPARSEAPTPITTPTAEATPSPQPVAKRRQSILYWRKSVFDPDRLFNWLEPKIRILWTRSFLLMSMAAILAATLVAWANSQQLITQFTSALRWETVVLAWLTMIVATTCHEFAHGLTCKRYGGEVHEIGFLLMFFMPCFYCNVTDAWLFREKSKRLWVTLAGAYCDLCIWALAVFLWRVTYQDTLVNYLAWVVASVAGIRAFFNFNPLLKLDGYYLLSDAVEIPNLRQRGVDSAMAHLRWWLWGATRPDAQPRGRFLFGYGLLCWLFSLGFITLMLVGMGSYVSAHVGPAGYAISVVLGVMVGRGLLKGLFAGEMTTMIWKRHVRTLGWVTAICLITAAMFLIPWTDQATGNFEVRPLTHSEIRAPVSAFLEEVYYGEGEEVSDDDLIAQLSIPDLSSRIAQKDAEFREAKANLMVLRFGRSKEIVQQRGAFEAAEAKVARLQEESRYLKFLDQSLLLRSSVNGLVMTPRLKEKIGSYFAEGELICEIEDPQTLEAVVTLDEEQAADIQPGQTVRLKARALPFEVFEARVERIAPQAVEGDLQSTVTVYCRMQGSHEELRSSMTGYARIERGHGPIGVVFAKRCLRLIRTEFWW